MKESEMYKKLIVKMMKDDDFKKRVKETPDKTMKEFLQKECGVNPEILKKTTFKSYTEKKDEYMVVIPHAVSENRLLTEEELSQTSGGYDWGC